MILLCTKGSKCDFAACDDVAEEDENEMYQPARRRMRIHERVVSPVRSMSEHDETVSFYFISSFLGYFFFWSLHVWN